MASLQKTSVTTTGNAIYTSSGNSVVTFLSLCNYTAGNVTANLYVIPNGSSADSSTIVLANLLITAQDTYQFYVGNEKLILSNGDSITVSANSNAAITTIASYTSA
jgi:hypothetical protein